MITKEQILELRKYPNSLYFDFRAQFLFHSNKIEGSTFSVEQLSLLMDKRIVSGHHDWEDVLETKNSVDAFEYVMDSLDYSLSQSFILDLHKILKTGTRDEYVGQAGVWKKIPNSLSGTEIKLAQPWEVPHKVEQLLRDWEDGQKTLKDVCKFHADFEKIHPFLDGNGRVGRFLILHQCLTQGFVPVTIDSALSSEYKKSLGSAQLGSGLEDLLDIFEKAQELFMQKDIVKDTLKSLGLMKGDAF